MTENTLDDVLSGGGARSAFTKESPLGTTVSGTIVDATTSQINDYMTGKPKSWDDGRPQMQIVVRIKTDLNEPREDGSPDDGVRGVYIKTWGVWKEALVDSIRGIGKVKVSEALVPGNTFSATFSGTKPSSQGSDTKLYSYAIKEAQGNLDDAMGADKGTGELPPQAAPAAATAPVAAPAVQAVAPVATPAAVPAPAPASDPIATARQLIALGIDDNTIATNTGLDPTVLAAIRNQAA